MNRKQLTILLVSGVIIGAVGLMLYTRQTASWETKGAEMGQKVLPDFAINEVAQVTIKDGQGELNLARLEDRWTVKERWNYPANFGEVSGLLRKLWDLKAVRTLKVGPSQLARLELLPPDSGTNNAGTVLRFKDKSGKELHSLLLGKKEMRTSEADSPFGGGGGMPVGRYIKGAGDRVLLVGDALADVESKPDRWLSKDFFKVEKLKAVSVTSTNATNSWKLVRDAEGGELKLADKKEGEDLDTSKASGAGFALSSPSFNDVISPESKPEEIGLDKPRVAALETFDGFTYTVRLGNKTADDNYHLRVAVEANIGKERTPGKDEKPEDKEKLDKEFQEKVKKLEEKLKAEKDYEKWTYLVSKWTVDPLLKERHELLAEKKVEPPPTSDSATSPAPVPAPAPIGNPPVKPAEPKKADEIILNPPFPDPDKPAEPRKP